MNNKRDNAFNQIYESKNYFWNPEGEMLNKWPKGFTGMNTKYVEPTLVAAHCMYGSRVDIINKEINGEIVVQIRQYLKFITSMGDLLHKQCVSKLMDFKFDNGTYKCGINMMCTRVYHIAKASTIGS